MSCPSPLLTAGSLQVLEDEQAGLWSCCCYSGNLAELHLPAQTFSAWKSNSLSRTPLCFMIGFQRQPSPKILHQIEISTVWGEKWHQCTLNDSIKSDHRMGGDLVMKMIALSHTRSSVIWSCWITFHVHKSWYSPHTVILHYLGLKGF